MDNSTLTKAPAKSKVKKETENIMKHVIDTNEHISYIIETLKSHAEMLKEQQHLLERIRTSMGL